MEILQAHQRNLRFTVPPDLAQATYKVFKGDTQLGSTGNATIEDGVASVPVGFPETSEAGQLRVELSFIHGSKTYTMNETVEVVTPILQKFEILDIHPNATDDEVWAVESATRHIIQAYTGQTFGRFTDTLRVRGTGSFMLVLPHPIISLTSLNDIGGGRFIVSDDRWSIAMISHGIPPVKADYYGLHITNGVIHNPNNVRLGSFSAKSYLVDGEWGYESVPEPVREAAKLLINDYACAEQAYRDRYLSSMTAADWRISFNTGAFLRTGNARADHLLKDYVKRNWLVI